LFDATVAVLRDSRASLTAFRRCQLLYIQRLVTTGNAHWSVRHALMLISR